MVLTTAIVSPTAVLFPPLVGQHCLNQRKSFISTPKNVTLRPFAGLKPLGLRLQARAKKSGVFPVVRMTRASVTCSASLSATCAATKTQTVVDKRMSIDRLPTIETKKPKNKERYTPELDNNDGNPPNNGRGGWGGGGGDEGPFYGGFYLFLFLAFVTWLNEEAEKSRYVKNYRQKLQKRIDGLTPMQYA